MAPSKKPSAKGSSKAKDSSKGKDSKDEEKAGASKLKAATAINTRHILVSYTPLLSFPPPPTPTIRNDALPLTSILVNH